MLETRFIMVQTNKMVMFMLLIACSRKFVLTAGREQVKIHYILVLEIVSYHDTLSRIWYQMISINAKAGCRYTHTFVPSRVRMTKFFAKTYQDE